MKSRLRIYGVKATVLVQEESALSYENGYRAGICLSVNSHRRTVISSTVISSTVQVLRVKADDTQDVQGAITEWKTERTSI
jgi:hypothetical protein